MRNELVTCIIKIGEERGRKSALEKALRTDKNRYIEASRVISYRFFSVGRASQADGTRNGVSRLLLVSDCLTGSSLLPHKVCFASSLEFRSVASSSV